MDNDGSFGDESIPLLLQPQVGKAEASARRKGTNLILFSLMLERIAYYSLYGNLLLYLNKDPLCWDSSGAVTAALVFSGTSFFWGVLGGWVGDSIIGKYWAVVLGYSIYTVSYAYFPTLSAWTDLHSNASMYDEDPSVVTCHGRNETIAKSFLCTDWRTEQPCIASMYVIIIFLGLGHALVQTNLAPFGSDQVKHLGSENLQSFFLRYYWFVNVGALIANLGLSYMLQEYNFFWGFVSSTGCLMVSAIIFMCGYPLYLKRPLNGSTLKTFFQIHFEAIRVWRRQRQARPSGNFETSEEFEKAPKLLDYALMRHGGVYHEAAVQDCRSLHKVLIVFTMLLPYWICYFQINSSYMLQVLHLRLPSSNMTDTTYSNGTSVSADSFVLPANALTLFNNVFLIVGLPVMNHVVYPWCNRTGRQMTMLLRMSLGMALCFLSIISASLVENFRKHIFLERGPVYQVIGKSVYKSADLTVFAVVPQYALLGLSEIFLTVPGMEYAYIQAPKAMQGLVMGLFYASAGVGGFIGALLPSATSGVNLDFFSTGIKDSINEGSHLDYYFYFLAGIQLVGIVVFLIVGKKVKLGLERVPAPKSRFLRNTHHVNGTHGLSSGESNWGEQRR